MRPWAHLAALAAATAVVTPPLGAYLARIYGGGAAPGDRIALPVERLVYRLTNVDPEGEQGWTGYAASVLAFGLVSVLLMFAVLRLQGVLPLNPTRVPGVPPHLAFNIAASFTTNTNWQNYSGEGTLSHLSQMTLLTVQNFASAAAGMAVMAAFVRGLARRRAETVGNFWVDVTRTTTRLLLPAALVFAVVLVSQGVIQNLDGFATAQSLEGATQQIPGGPVASQVAIKQIGTNGGGFFGANSAHPFENPTGITNFLSTLALVAVPLASALMFGRMIGDRRNGRAIFAAMSLLLLMAVVIAVAGERGGNPQLRDVGVDQAVAADSPGGNLEGKEVRFGPTASAVWAAATTATSNGSVNSMHDSLTPIAGLVTLGNMLLGEVSPGGVGVGLTGMLIHVVIAVFIAGLMVGRTPEYLGKKIQGAEVKLAMLYLLAMPILVLGLAAASVLVPGGLDARANPGPHGLSELLYAIASPANNNGSAFAGFASNTAWYNPVQSFAMLAGRFLLIVPVLAIAGSLGRKQVVAAGPGTFPTHNPLFVGLLVGVVVIVAGLTFFPVLALGPIVEALSV